MFKNCQFYDIATLFFLFFFSLPGDRLGKIFDVYATDVIPNIFKLILCNAFVWCSYVFNVLFDDLILQSFVSSLAILFKTCYRMVCHRRPQIWALAIFIR